MRLHAGTGDLQGQWRLPDPRLYEQLTASKAAPRVELIGDPEQAPHALRMAQKLATWGLTKAERTMTGIKLTKDGLKEAAAERRG